MQQNDQIITIVTGLPRSGTSMMMQMLEAGGLPALTDGRRKADEDNPRGYLEFDQARRLHLDNSWLPEARGKAVKVVAQLLMHLPKEVYRIIVMQRDMSEIIGSQRAMLRRTEKQGARLPDPILKDIFSKQLLGIDKMLEKNQIPLMRVGYKACIDDPQTVVAEVNRFLGVAR